VSRPWSRTASRAQRTLLRTGSVLVLAGAMSGCGVGFGAQTLKVKQPADGTVASTGNVSVLDAVVVSDGSQCSVFFTLANREPQGSPLTLQSVMVGGTQATLSGPTQVPPASTLQVGGRGGAAATLSGAQLTPGTLVPLSIGVAGRNPIVMQAPVVTPTGYYATVTPGASSQPSVTAAPSAVASNTPETPFGPTPGARPGAPGTNQNENGGTQG
jgi:hypothetical protein